MSIPDTPANRKLLRLPPKEKPRGRVLLVAASFTPPSTWVVPLETRNESNLRDYRARNRRAGAAWKAVREAVKLWHLSTWEFEHQIGRPVYARFTRLAPKTLDAMVGLPAAMKGVEDVCAFLLGIDDASPLWVATCSQRVSPAYGVMIELSTEPFK